MPKLQIDNNHLVVRVIGAKKTIKKSSPHNKSTMSLIKFISKGVMTSNISKPITTN